MCLWAVAAPRHHRGDTLTGMHGRPTCRPVISLGMGGSWRGGVIGAGCGRGGWRKTQLAVGRRRLIVWQARRLATQDDRPMPAHRCGLKTI